mgnify:CR=1 FL=1|jgi:hypothetical protein
MMERSVKVVLSLSKGDSGGGVGGTGAAVFGTQRA